MECQQLLVAGVDICVHCGTTIQATTVQSSPNRFKRIGKPGKYGVAEETEFSFTDHAATELAAVIGGIITGRPQQQTPFQARPNPAQVLIPPIALGESPSEQDIVDEGTGEEAPQTPLVDTNPQGAARFFRHDGDFLLQRTKDYKGTNHAEQQRRFILLYADAYLRLVGKPAPNTDHIKLAAEKVKIIDKSNFSKYLTHITDKFLLLTTTGVEINDDGKAEIERIIAEIDNSQIQAGFAYADKPASTAAPRYRLTNKDKALLQEWAKVPVELGELDVLGIKTGRDYALLAYWLLITHLEKGQSFRWNIAYEYLKAKFKAVQASPDKFSEAIRSSFNTEYFSKADEAYYLSPTANILVQEWIDGKSKPQTNSTKAK